MRTAYLHRKTTETDIKIEINLDGEGKSKVDSSIPFLDHMLKLMAYHGRIDLILKAQGDIEIDYHHLIEDIGITLGEVIKKALKDKVGIRRYGFSKIPMDETLAEVVIDLSGRAYLVYKIKQKTGNIKDLPVCLFEDFFRALSNHAMINLHIILHYGRDLHHIYEAIFKAFGKALHEAAEIISDKLPSTKGTL